MSTCWAVDPGVPPTVSAKANSEPPNEGDLRLGSTDPYTVTTLGRFNVPCANVADIQMTPVVKSTFLPSRSVP